MPATPRQLFLAFHQWTGLVLGALVSIVAITGAILVFQPHFETTTNPRLWDVSPGPHRVPLAQLVETARAAHPAAQVESVRSFGRAGAPFLVYFKDKIYVHLNPYTGEVLGERARYGEGWGFVQGIHKFLTLEPSIGEPITGTNALFLALLIVTGLILWWPATRRALVAGLTLNPKLKGRPWNLNLHKLIGIYAAVVLLFCSVSGLPISFDWAKNALYPLTGTRKVAPPAAPAAAGFVGLDAVAAQLLEIFPDAQELYIPWPKDNRVAAYAIEANAAHANARSYAWFNAASGKLLRAAPYAEQNAGFRSYYWLMSLHTGVAGGPFWQAFLFVGAIAAPVLVGTGALSYFQRRRNRAQTATVARSVLPAKPAGS